MFDKPIIPMQTIQFPGLPNTYTIPTAFAVESESYPGCYYRTVNGVTEWINPPMVPGTEYRTTERWNGEAVYTKLVHFAAMPGKTSTANPNIKSYAHGGNAKEVFRVHGAVSAGWYLPMHDVEFDASSTQVGIKNYSTTDYSSYSANVQIWYTKN